MSLATATLVEWAREEGFDRAGVAELGPSQYEEELRRWLERGDHASMAWLERRLEVRTDPRRVLPGAVSVLCVALQYFPPPSEGERAGEPEAPGDLWPGVARYARGDDYHDLMLAGLARLEERIRAASPGAVTRRYVDTGPLLERELAQRAGLGRIGKHTNLLHRDGGSWFLLGEILLALELEPSPPSVSDMCGRCTRCLDACPTGALPEPFRLDSRRCISYWTIEHRGVVPRQVRAGMGEWVFGCDVCQEVCPWNRRAAPGHEDRFEIPQRRRDLDLVGLLRLEREAYVERFRKSPMKRAKLGGLKRNAAIAMGNRGEARYLGPLLEELDRCAASDPELAAQLAWAVGRIGERAADRGDEASARRAGAALEGVLSGAASEMLREEAEAALGSLRSRRLSSRSRRGADEANRS